MIKQEVNLYDKSLIKKLNKQGYNSHISIKQLIFNRLKENLFCRERSVLLELLEEINSHSISSNLDGRL